MNTTITLLSLILLTFAAPSAPVTPEVAAYRAAMDHAQDIQDSLRDAFDAKDTKQIATLSSQLTSILQEDQRYWQKHQVADAIQRSKESIEAAQQLNTAALAGNSRGQHRLHHPPGHLPRLPRRPPEKRIQP